MNHLAVFRISATARISCARKLAKATALCAIVFNYTAIDSIDNYRLGNVRHSLLDTRCRVVHDTKS